MLPLNNLNHNLPLHLRILLMQLDCEEQHRVKEVCSMSSMFGIPPLKVPVLHRAGNRTKLCLPIFSVSTIPGADVVNVVTVITMLGAVHMKDGL